MINQTETCGMHGFLHSKLRVCWEPRVAGQGEQLGSFSVTEKRSPGVSSSLVRGHLRPCRTHRFVGCALGILAMLAFRICLNRE